MIKKMYIGNSLDQWSYKIYKLMLIVVVVLSIFSPHDFSMSGSMIIIGLLALYDVYKLSKNYSFISKVYKSETNKIFKGLFCKYAFAGIILIAAMVVADVMGGVLYLEYFTLQYIGNKLNFIWLVVLTTGYAIFVLMLLISIVIISKEIEGDSNKKKNLLVQILLGATLGIFFYFNWQIFSRSLGFTPLLLSSAILYGINQKYNNLKLNKKQTELMKYLMKIGLLFGAVLAAPIYYPDYFSYGYVNFSIFLIYMITLYIARMIGLLLTQKDSNYSEKLIILVIGLVMLLIEFFASYGGLKSLLISIEIYLIMTSFVFLIPIPKIDFLKKFKNLVG